MQDSFRYRAKFLGLKIATLLIDDKGELKKGISSMSLIGCLGRGRLFLEREGDALIFGHIRDV